MTRHSSSAHDTLPKFLAFFDGWLRAVKQMVESILARRHSVLVREALRLRARDRRSGTHAERKRASENAPDRRRTDRPPHINKTT